MTAKWSALSSTVRGLCKVRVGGWAVDFTNHTDMFEYVIDDDDDYDAAPNGGDDAEFDDVDDDDDTANKSREQDKLLCSTIQPKRSAGARFWKERQDAEERDVFSPDTDDVDDINSLSSASPFSRGGGADDDDVRFVESPPTHASSSDAPTTTISTANTLNTAKSTAITTTAAVTVSATAGVTVAVTATATTTAPATTTSDGAAMFNKCMALAREDAARALAARKAAFEGRVFCSDAPSSRTTTRRGGGRQRERSISDSKAEHCAGGIYTNV
jgi:hypothetical protein